MPGRRPSAEGDPPPLDIELFDPASEGDEVHFGGRRNPRRATSAGRHRRWWIAGAVVVVAAVVGTIVVVNTGDDNAGTASTRVPASTRPTSASRPPTTLAPSVPVTTDGVDTTGVDTTIVRSTFPPFVPGTRPGFPQLSSLPAPLDGLPGADPDWRLYLWDTASGPTTLVSYNVVTGVVEPIDLVDVGGPIRAVVATPAGPVVDAGAVVAVTATGVSRPAVGDSRVTATELAASGPRLAATPSGRVWIRRLDAPEVDLYDPSTGGIVDHATMAADFDLIGSSSTGVPVVRGPDLRTFLLGSGAEFPEAPTSRVEFGWYVTLSCDPVIGCVFSVRGRPGRLMLVPTPESIDQAAFRFAPDGSCVAMWADDSLLLVDAETGSDVTAKVTWVPSGDPVSGPVDSYLRTARDLVWTPDSQYLVLLTDQGVVVVDRTGAPVGTVVLDPSDPTRYVPLALG